MSSPCPILTPINLYHSSPRFLTTIQSFWNTQPHVRQSIEAQRTSWGQGCSYFVVKSLPFWSNSAPFRVTPLLLHTSLTRWLVEQGLLIRHAYLSFQNWVFGTELVTRSGALMGVGLFSSIRVSSVMFSSPNWVVLWQCSCAAVREHSTRVVVSSLGWVPSQYKCRSRQGSKFSKVDINWSSGVGVECSDN